MRLLKKIISAALALCLLAMPAAAADETVPAQTLPPIIEAVYRMDVLPGKWSPLSERTVEKELILNLTSDRLYRLRDDASGLVPSLAAAMPEDVTGEYSGRYGVPEDAVRGYAFRVKLNPQACWEDGKAVTADDWYFTLCTMLEAGVLEVDVANAGAYLHDGRHSARDVVSLADAGFSSVAEAMDAGFSQFFVDTTWFWGLDYGWVDASDRQRLKDAAIPSGCDEMYVSGAYLYERYLGENGSQNYLQSEFVGVGLTEGAPVTLEDVGIIRESADQLLLILEEPATVSALAAQLSEIYPLRQDMYTSNYATSADTYLSCGPYRIVSVGMDEIRLEPNPRWSGSWTVQQADAIRFVTGS